MDRIHSRRERLLCIFIHWYTNRIQGKSAEQIRMFSEQGQLY